MSLTTRERLDRIESKLNQPDFLLNKGLGNEVGYYIFDYPSRDELLVREHVKQLTARYAKGQMSFQVVEFDLYEIVLHILRGRGYLEKSFDFERLRGIDYAYEAITKTLRLNGDNNLIVRHIIDHIPENSVVFLTGVGKCYPIVRSHNVLNNLHQVLDTVPVVMFYPGQYSGHDLRLFGTLKDDNYYRAFQLIV
jgi:hypothetical protein